MFEWEPVLTVEDYFDGIRSGVAEYRGKAHCCQSVWDDAKQDWAGEWRGRSYLSYFWLKPVPPGVLESVLEGWAIWCRWHAAFHDGRTDISTHPALPEDRARHKVLQVLLEPLCKVDPASALRQVGEIRRARGAQEGKFPGGGYPLEVRWSESDGGHSPPPDEDE